MASQQYTPFVFNTGGVLGLVVLLVGINAILRPRSALQSFRFDPPKAPEAQRLVDNLMVLYGSRDVFIGVATLVAWCYQHHGILGWVLVASGGVGFVDGAVSRAQVGKYEWNHWTFVPVWVSAGVALIRSQQF